MFYIRLLLKWCICILLIEISVISFAFAQEKIMTKANTPELTPTRVNGNAPVIDGDLSDPIWQRDDLDFARDFIQREPDEGIAATESTLVAVAYDDHALYFAYWCYDDNPEEIDRQLVRRDRWGESDIVTVRLDPYHDHQTGYRFDLSAAGVQRDCRLYNDDWTDYSWDGVWMSGVKAQPWGWSAEIMIPFHCLRFTEKEEHTWGMNVTRYISRRNESPWWAFSPSAEHGFVSKFGHLTGLKGIKPSRHLEFLPYAVSGIETEPKDDGNPDGRDYIRNVGFDLKYGISSNLILDAAINPDFGQVELDRPVLNLSAYETYYEEKRPFFLEGANLFDTRYSLFYSRRIGHAPQGEIDDEDNYVYDPDYDFYTKYPKSVTILSAAKITGKLPMGTSIAFLNALTQEEQAEYVNTSGENLKGLVEPSANYSVLRVQQDVLTDSYVGGLMTLSTQDRISPVTTGGVDWRLFTPDKKLALIGQTVFSHNEDGETGWGIDAEIDKAAGEHWLGEIGVEINDPNLDLNKVGYLSRNDERGGWFWCQYRTNKDWWIFRNTWNNINLYASWNYAGYNIDKGGNYNFTWDFINNWALSGGISTQLAEYDDKETRGNGPWKRTDSWSWWASLTTDPRKPVSININPGSGQARFGHWWANWIGVTYCPASNISLELGTNYCRSFHQIIWVDNVEDTSIFADMDQDELDLRLTANVVLTRDLSIQLSGQGYISGINYENYRRHIGDHAYIPYAMDEEEDFNYTALNSTFILRWEYRPGSTLYIVWTRAMSETKDFVNDLEVSRDLDNLFSGDAENVFLIKASYWWNL